MNNSNALYIVATPIGNLGDMTIRAQEVLRLVDIIAAEDTRHSARLLQHFQISTPLLAYHDHTNEAQTQRLLDRLISGDNVALISDAGTPLISDPGYRLVAMARQQGVNVVPIPGASAVITALCAAGLASDRFAFEGFLPAKTGARQQRLEPLAADPRTLIFYESPHRIQESLQAMAQTFGEGRQLVLARELTKTFETFLSGSFIEVLAMLEADANQLRGEMVVLVQGYSAPSSEADSVDPEAQRIMRILMSELPLKQAAALAAQISTEKKNKLYQWGLQEKN
ncbi:16S rRNA (cytidine(1402)-2'-O)-methyltransferase [Teredinibacter waterburyi]|uniref:16S rRNA (cytidine(1402)-2'-O)-methyltransferase n=1 Tax=Teredinibacter waterburyi TaxID=1500538 RepID=UPI00165F6423|nr:16S rRNA (cytidine(1402)-2'-O)-methyltransferase [Teredinibacter waterburyi]